MIVHNRIYSYQHKLSIPVPIFWFVQGPHLEPQHLQLAMRGGGVMTFLRLRNPTTSSGSFGQGE